MDRVCFSLGSLQPQVEVPAPLRAGCCHSVCIFRYEQAWLCSTSCLQHEPWSMWPAVALNAFLLSNNNIVFNWAEPNSHTSQGAREREKQLQREPPACTFPDEHLYWVKDKSKLASSTRHGRIGFRLCTSLWSFRRNLWVPAQRGNNKNSNRSPTLKQARLEGGSYKRHVSAVIGTESKIKRQAHTRRMTTAFDKPPLTNSCVWVRRCILLGFRFLSTAKTPFKGWQESK